MDNQQEDEPTFSREAAFRMAEKRARAQAPRHVLAQKAVGFFAVAVLCGAAALIGALAAGVLGRTSLARRMAWTADQMISFFSSGAGTYALIAVIVIVGIAVVFRLTRL